KLPEGETITILRPKENSPHHLEDLVGYSNLVSSHVFSDRNEELQWIAEDISQNIHDEELQPEEIAVITLTHKNASDESEILSTFLLEHKVKAVSLMGVGAFDYFRKAGHVTISAIHRAKGNEASLVYVYGMENVASNIDLVINRNKAF